MQSVSGRNIQQLFELLTISPSVKLSSISDMFYAFDLGTRIKYQRSQSSIH